MMSVEIIPRNVVIVGYGTVGKVTSVIMPHWVNVITYDIDKKSGAEEIGGPIPKGDIYFVCTHEMYAGDVVDKIRKTDPGAYIVVRSTVLPGFCQVYHQHEPISHVLHFPAFHKEVDCIRDFFLRVPYLIIGECCFGSSNYLVSLLKHHNKPIIITDTNTSALSKLVNNTKLASEITFWNEINEIAKRFNCDIETIAKVANMDTRHQSHGTRFFGEPWGGKCLPKDVTSLVKLAGDFDGEYLKALQKSNETLISKKKKEDTE